MLATTQGLVQNTASSRVAFIRLGCAENRAELTRSSRDFNCEPRESYRTNGNMAVSGEGVKVLNLHGITSTKGVYLLVYSQGQISLGLRKNI